MKYTSPYKKTKSKTPNIAPTTIQNSPPKQHNQSYNQKNPQNTSLRTYQSKSSNISYFQQSKYKVTDKTQFSPTKHVSKDRQLESSSNSRLKKINKLLENITNKHKEMKSKLTQMKQNTSNNQENNGGEYTFTPHILHNPRYFIPSSLSERTKGWGQQRAKHYTSIRQQLVSQEIKECTFSPKLIAKPRSTKILKDKAIQQKRARQTRLQDIYMDGNDKQVKNKEQVTPGKKKDSKALYKAADFEKIRGLIKYEMKRINFDF